MFFKCFGFRPFKFLVMIALLGPAHGSSSSQELIQEETIRNQKTKEGMTSLLGLVSQPTLAGEVLKYLTPPDIESLRVSHTKDHPDDTKEMKDLKTKFKKLESVIKSFNKAFVIRRTTVTNLSKRPEMTTLFKGLVVEAHHEDHLRDLKYISYALAQKLDLSLLNYLEATVEDLGALETLLGKASQRAHMHLDVYEPIRDGDRPKSNLWKDQKNFRSVSLKFYTVQDAVDFLTPLSRVLRYEECPDLYVYIGKGILDPKFYKPDLTPLNSLKSFFKDSHLFVYAYGAASEHTGATNTFMYQVNPRLMAAGSGKDQLPPLDKGLLKDFQGWRPATVVDAHYWALEMCKTFKHKEFLPRFTQCFCMVPIHHRRIVLLLAQEFCKSFEDGKLPNPDGQEVGHLGNTLAHCIDFLRLFAYGHEAVLVQHKEPCFKILRSHSMFIYGKNIREALAVIPGVERPEVLDVYESLAFPERTDLSRKIEWLSFMPKGERKKMWPIFYAEAKTFAEKHSLLSPVALMNAACKNTYLHGHRFQPGFFPLVDLMNLTWETKSKKRFYATSSKGIILERVEYLQTVPPFVAALPADQRAETVQLLENAPVMDMSDKHQRWDDKILNIDDDKRLPVLRAAEQYIFPDMSVYYYGNILSGFSKIAGAKGTELSEMLGVLDPVLKKFQVYFAELAVSDRNGYLICICMRNISKALDDRKLQAARHLVAVTNIGLPVDLSHQFITYLNKEDPMTWTQLTDNLCTRLSQLSPKEREGISGTVFGFYSEVGLSGAIKIFEKFSQVKPELRGRFQRILSPYCGWSEKKIQAPLTLDQVLDDAVKALNGTNPASS